MGVTEVASSQTSQVRLAKAAPTRVLVVDDEPELRRGVSRMLRGSGIEVVEVDGGSSALATLQRQSFHVAIVDLMMPGMDGLALLTRLRAEHPEVEVIMMTAFGDVDVAVRSVRAGAYHFLEKPFRSQDEVLLAVNKAAERRHLLHRNAVLERRLQEEGSFGDLLGASTAMREVSRRAMGVAPTGSTVLILGESGTGKEVTARGIHKHSPRAVEAFVPVNCSAIPDSLVESELFGHVRGAFTGATEAREGMFAAADKGTIFLDEVGDLPLLAQVKLLRVLQEGEIKPVGSNKTRRVDVRVLAATNVDLREKIAEGTFREDLYYRLNVVSIELPPLRRRREDIPALAQYFLRLYAKKAARVVDSISPEAMAILRSQSWPGNVRQLQNAMEHAIVYCQHGSVTPADLPDAGLDKHAAPSFEVASSRGLPQDILELPYKEAKERALSLFNRGYFEALMHRTGGNKSQAAREAGLDRSNFRRASRRWTENEEPAPRLVQ